MRLLIQRVAHAEVVVSGELHSEIGGGLLILVGIEHHDTTEDADWLAGKCARLRVFPDLEGVMNLDVCQVAGEFMVVSQFTLHASTRKGNRPSYIRAAGEEHARPLYDYFATQIERLTNLRVARGVFGADMQVGLVNDGPVTIWMDSRDRE